jgi:hypothetical protein
MLPAKFGFIWPSSFRGDFFNSSPFGQQIWLPRAILVSDWLMLNKSSLLKLLGQMEPSLAGSIYVRYSIKLLHMVPFGQQTWNQKKELLLASCLLAEWNQMKKLYRRSYIDASYQVWFNLAKQFQRRRFA